MKSKKGFTLIELVVAFTIVAILSMASYAPYNYYRNKAKLKNTASKITQTLYKARNMAVNGIVGVDGNVSIGVFFDRANNNKINIYSYPHDIDQINIGHIESSDIKKIQTIYLDKGIQIDNVEGNDNLLFFFNSILGDVKYYTWNGAARSSIIDNEVQISFSYKGSTSPNLNNKISYFTSTNIIDY